MSKKTIEFCNTVFELLKPVESVGNRDYTPGCDWGKIKNVYGRPSVHKIGIWHDWCAWCDAVNKTDGYECGLWISSHNCRFFSISGYIKVPSGKTYSLWITRRHNRAYEEL